MAASLKKSFKVSLKLKSTISVRGKELYSSQQLESPKRNSREISAKLITEEAIHVSFIAFFIKSQNLNNKDIYSTSNYELLESKSQSISPSVNNENSTKDESQHCNDGELYGEESHNLLRSVHKKYTLIAVRSEEFGRE
ncbi:hypothetical protein RCL_jg14940.t1 [Rhizophagus clarus]|uniref:Uncharacterized protein n=1 Tax=Rhizophagus clarus TaxID=94130 RepID=A0A8H3R0M7_9GLOM|nr:hypothetical protein RCL_jg14940.t1 [Rhizophagus clarus]